MKYPNDNSFHCFLKISCSFCKKHQCNANMFNGEEVEYCENRYSKSAVDCCNNCKFSTCIEKEKEGVKNGKSK